MAASSPAPFRVFLRLRTRPGSAQAFEQAWNLGADLIAGQAGSRGQWLARGTEAADTYYVVSDWADEESFRCYERSSAHAGHLARLRPYRAAGEMWTMAVLRDIPPATPLAASQQAEREAP